MQFDPHQDPLLEQLWVMGANGRKAPIMSQYIIIGEQGAAMDVMDEDGSEFVQKMDDVCRIANYEEIEIVSPYLNNTKIEILTDGLNMGLDYSKTWTCYNGREKACGKCGACQERLEAFELNQASDPLPYEAN